MNSFCVNLSGFGLDEEVVEARRENVRSNLDKVARPKVGTGPFTLLRYTVLHLPVFI